MSAFQRCRKCGTQKSIDLFPRNSRIPGGYDRMCKVCWKAGKSRSAARKSGPKAEIVQVDIRSENVPTVMIDSPLSLVRGRHYIQYAGMSAQEVVEAFHRKYNRLPDEIVFQGNISFVAVSPAEADARTAGIL